MVFLIFGKMGMKERIGMVVRNKLMSKANIVYTCSNCDAQYPKWVGRCSQCGKFGTISTAPVTMLASTKVSVQSVPAATVHLASLGNQKVNYLATGLAEFDRVLGGGLVASGVLLLTGEPGVGKSTLLLTLAERLQQVVLYISGEEAASQISGRLHRLNLSGQQLHFASETNILSLNQSVRNLQPSLVVVDSLQTMYVDSVAAEPGSPSQVRAVLAELVGIAKETGAAVVVIGHVTKEGVAAGPKTVEHLVDVVLSLEGVEQQGLRFLRANKNRFGPTDEVGVFQMQEEGLLEVSNPSSLFLAQRHQGAGSCVTALLEGSRSLLVEVQALVTRSRLAYPKRATTGFDFNRLQVLLAVLGERAGLKLNFSDVYVNLAGGFRSKEPALDLAVCLAIASAYFKKPLPQDVVVFGEVGLGGEVRQVVALEKRLQESARLGFTQAVIGAVGQNSKIPSKLSLAVVQNINEAVEWVR